MSAPSKTKIKICGIRTPDAMTAALEAGADFVGLVFAANSPRYVDIEVATYLASYVPDSVKVVGLFLDMPAPAMEEILNEVRIDLLQLHGRETPEDCAAIAARFDRPVMKALPVTDLASAKDYAATCNWLVIDAPVPDGSAIPGGNGIAFDWSHLRDFDPGIPWMLAGGLTPENVAEAICIARPAAVDVSSGVEASRGVKDLVKIRAFIEAAKSA